MFFQEICGRVLILGKKTTSVYIVVQKLLLNPDSDVDFSLFKFIV